MNFAAQLVWRFCSPSAGRADHPEGFRCDFLAGIAWGKGDNFLVVPDGTADCQEITALREWLLKLTTEPLAKRAGVGRSV
jgi:hypothetical protein